MAVETQKTVSMETDIPTPAPMKFSRYRSVRRTVSQRQDNPKAVVPAAPIPPVPSGPISLNNAEPTGKQGSSIGRSMSRYRHKRNPGPSTDSQPPVAPPPYVSSAQQPGSPRYEDEATRQRHREDAMDRLTGGDSTVPSKPSQEPTTKIRPRNKTDNKIHDFFSVDQQKSTKRIDENHANEQLSKNGIRLRSLKGTMKLSRSKGDPKDEQASTKPTETTGGSFPGTDAPVSAANAGERRVLVQYRKLSNYLPVKPSTTVEDLLYSAQNCLTNEIDAQGFIVIEFFTALGLERPLRKYEYIRNVMNSWTSDDDNALIIVPPASLEVINQLEIQSAPTERPIDMTFHIYHCQRPRKWDKRYVTLRADGQVTVSKKYQAQEQTNICHLSDFEIYSPTASALSNNVKPPRKICYAVKSQQKASMFLSTENYVHYLSTSDKTVAEDWYKAVQVWRSWYLVDVLGAGQREEESVEVTRKPSDASSNLKQDQPKRFKPLLEFNAVDQQHYKGMQPSEDTKSPKSRPFFPRMKSGSSPSSYREPLTVNTKIARSASQEAEGSPFSPTGLLGQTYVKRQRAMQEREETEKAYDAFNPQGLVSGAGGRRPSVGAHSQPSSRSNTMMTGADPSGPVQRSQSVGKANPKPLVDLTPVYQEPPQHARKGRGVAVEGGVPLVDAATGPELGPNAIAVPPATTWKRPPIPEEPSTPDSSTKAPTRSNTVRSSRYRRPKQTADASPTSSIDHGPSSSANAPFMPNGILARSTNSNTVHSVPVGHGLATGDRNATKPMLDLSPQNPFAEGSLLRDL